jgi:hypothetical protein
MSAELSTLVTAVGGAFLGKFVGPIAEHYGKAALERLQLLVTKAEQLLADVSRVPQAVEPKLLVPLVQAAALETDESLANKWSALLANAADPAQRMRVTPSFAEVLRQLSLEDARTLELIYSKVLPDETNGEISKHPDPEGDKFARVPELRATLQFDALTLQACIDNLLRLRLCAIPDGTLGDDEWLFNTFPPVYCVSPTVFGYQFKQACAPPTA